MPNLNAPATPEAILLSINDIKKKLWKINLCKEQLSFL
jgi:xanthine dehydrogenase molybdopterin-binding subunit B